MRITLIIAMWLSLAGCASGHKAQKSDSTGVSISIAPVEFSMYGKKAKADALEALWSAGDSVAVWADTIGLSYYRLVDGAGKSQARFDGPQLIEGVTYYASAPGSMPGDTLRGSAVAGPDGARFVLEHSAAFLRVSASLPKYKKATSIGIMPLSVEPMLYMEKLDSVSQKFSIVTTVKPGLPAYGALAAFVMYDDGGFGSSRLPAAGFEPGKGVEYRIEPVTETFVDNPSSISVKDVSQLRLSVASGEYSGICYVGGNTFAVVHDKGKGGGIHLFNIEFSSEGMPLVVTSAEAAGNAAQGSGKDNEGVVYLPDSNTLLVSSEGDQAIREYDLEGNPTGRSVSVPEDLKTNQGNAGFEALGFNAKTGLIWTVTEKSLKDDDPSILRLQSFSASTLEAGDRFFYRTTVPLIPENLSKSASAYVFGVPAVTALDDGRLIVLEREVYVPGGNVFQKAIGSFTHIALYVVDPVNDTAAFLQKQLLTEFTTSSVNLANFEGMCLGPKLADGRQTLILIADSQGGKSGLTGEYIRVLLIK